MTPESILDKGKSILMKKAQDYTNNVEQNRYENFERSGTIASWFNDPVHQAFASLIGTKLARLSGLLNTNKRPNNESIEDTFVDLCNYCALFGGYVGIPNTIPVSCSELKTGQAEQAASIPPERIPEYGVCIVHDNRVCGYCSTPFVINQEPAVVHKESQQCYHTSCYTKMILNNHGV